MVVQKIIWNLSALDWQLIPKIKVTKSLLAAGDTLFDAQASLAFWWVFSANRYPESMFNSQEITLTLWPHRHTHFYYCSYICRWKVQYHTRDLLFFYELFPAFWPTAIVSVSLVPKFFKLLLSFHVIHGVRCVLSRLGLVNILWLWLYVI